MAMTERVWLRNPETGGAFHCPADAADSWRARGWVDGEEPQQVNPAVAEWAPHPPAPEPAGVPEGEPAAEPEAEPATQPKTTTKARGTTAATSTEGVNDVG